ncbi:hypothetical protein [Paludifilum halophilum]|uniref:Uncharacterized protein n=1 Tax=Paludifilum halophilum TaxID=1642702 RepID=A0A235B484_9BACL|nr:hypothetical protein [Paludifilum halophilum]OYD06435.1 hypothetical protein CHM34_16200 [Paludifilum halophilum]
MKNRFHPYRSRSSKGGIVSANRRGWLRGKAEEGGRDMQRREQRSDIPSHPPGSFSDRIPSAENEWTEDAYPPQGWPGSNLEEKPSGKPKPEDWEKVKYLNPDPWLDEPIPGWDIPFPGEGLGPESEYSGDQQRSRQGGGHSEQGWRGRLPDPWMAPPSLPDTSDPRRKGWEDLSPRTDETEVVPSLHVRNHQNRRAGKRFSAKRRRRRKS